MEELLIDPGEFLFCKKAHRGNFDSGKVNAIEVNDNDKKESDKDIKGNSMEKMPKKKARKFVSIENEDKKLQLSFKNEISDSGKNYVTKEAL